MRYLLPFLAAIPFALANPDSDPTQGNEAYKPTLGDIITNCPPQNICGVVGDKLLGCVVPSKGDVCCSEGYVCPGGDFCLTKGYCCRKGVDPATCARDNGVTLPEGFEPGKTMAPGGAGFASTSAPAASSAANNPAPSSSTSAVPIAATTSSAPAYSSNTPATLTATSAAVAVYTSATTSYHPVMPSGNATIGAPSAGTPSATPVSFKGGAGAMQDKLPGAIVSAGFIGTVVVVMEVLLG